MASDPKLLRHSYIRCVAYETYRISFDSDGMVSKWSGHRLKDCIVELDNVNNLFLVDFIQYLLHHCDGFRVWD
jgi:hypothetical protein